jgi:hypothetical protein
MHDKQSHQAQGQKRRPYKKPEFVQVPLKPDEAVLGGCKSSTHAGPGGGGSCTHVSQCFTQTS